MQPNHREGKKGNGKGINNHTIKHTQTLPTHLQHVKCAASLAANGRCVSHMKVTLRKSTMV
jgi:hypothetical protein